MSMTGRASAVPAEGALEAMHRAGATAHPGVALDVGTLGEHVAGMAERQRAALGARTAEERAAWLLDRGVPGEIYLAAACERTVGGAWERFAAWALPWLRGVLERRGARPAEAEGVVGETPGLLVMPPASRQARTTIGTWDGRAKLTSWLAAIVLRRWAAQRIRTAAVVELPEDGRDPRRPAAPDPLEEALGTETAGRLLAALDVAWRALTPRERSALLLRYRGGLAQARIAALLGIGEPRVSRLLGAAVARLREATVGVVDPALERSPRLAAAVARWLATREGGDVPRDAARPAMEASRDA